MSFEARHFIKTVLPAQEAFETNTSLALPSKDKITHPTNQLKDRSIRVRQQVQLTLSRKGKRTIRNGTLPHGFTSRSCTDVRNGEIKTDYASISAACRPSRRVDVSRSPSPEFRQAHRSYGWPRCSTFSEGCRWGTRFQTLPAGRTVPTKVRLHRTAMSQHCARSQIMRSSRSYPSFHKASIKPPGLSLPPPRQSSPSDDVFLPSSPQHVSYMPVKQMAQVASNQTAQGVGEAVWLCHVRGESQRAGVVTGESQRAGVVTGESQRAGVVRGESQRAGVVKGESQRAGVVTGESQRAGVVRGESQRAGVVTGESQRAGVVTGESQRAGVVTGESQRAGVVTGESQRAGVVTGESQRAGVVTGESQRAGVVTRESQRAGVVREASLPHSEVSVEVDTECRKQAEEEEIQQTSAMVTEKMSKLDVTVSEMTLERAVNLLTHDNEDTQASSARFIQTQCFSSADAKKMMFYLHGIPKLLKLLQSDSEEVQQAGACALRNVVFESSENKMEIKDCEGVPIILNLLKRSQDIETRRQLTGLLWNLSSHDLLKELLAREAVKPLTDVVVVPCSGFSEGENPKDELLADPEVFYNATGCLRNISSTGPDGRKALRDCEGLIDSLVYYVRGTIADYNPDDMTSENCVCILHNLSYEISSELPQEQTPTQQESRDNPATVNTTGCFSVRSAKLSEYLQSECPMLEEKGNPHGIEWLWSAIAVRMYLSLIVRSSRPHTQEASIGALQNLTAGSGVISRAIAHTVVRKEGGLLQVKRMLQEGEPGVRRTSVSLLRNISRFRELHSDIVKQVLPELVAMLSYCVQDSDLPSEVSISLCHILMNLSHTSSQNVRAIVNHGALPKIIDISTKDNGFGPTRTAQAASVLLHTFWKHSELHGAYRKAGYRKADFINSRTVKAVNSAHD
ncbi:plakophilin-2 [Chanos chanos]|uniref:Plakophilin-2 n=1 Tax=Chanos chanos TaxID=29144 RepID=A0A6J2VK20_CHACN|nr:plakophilin-2 [Chanos chanos]